MNNNNFASQNGNFASQNGNFASQNGLLSPFCSVYDQAVPGTGPPGLVSAPAPSVEFTKYNDYYNLSLRWCWSRN